MTEHEAAELFGVPWLRVRSWCERDILPCVDLGVGKGYAIDAAEAVRLEAATRVDETCFLPTGAARYYALCECGNVCSIDRLKAVC